MNTTRKINARLLGTLLASLLLLEARADVDGRNEENCKNHGGALPTLQIVSHNGDFATFNAYGAEPGVTYRVTAADTLEGPFKPTGTLFTDGNAMGISIFSPVEALPLCFFRVEVYCPEAGDRGDDAGER